MSSKLSDILISQRGVTGDRRFGDFVPSVPRNLEETGLNGIFIEDLICKIILTHGALSGYDISRNIALPLAVIADILFQMKQRLILAYQDTSGVNDFIYALTETGKEKALLAREQTAYAGAAPVIFSDYLKSVDLQSIQNENPNEQDLREAFKSTVLPDYFFDLLGPAINSARGLFLYGAPGNGKTEVASRIADCYSQTIYIPKAVLVEGHLLQLYDPRCHVQVEAADNRNQDARWVHIKRPAVMAGGEMDLDSLEIGYNSQTGICEASLQLKGNGGVLVVDDFGRQKIGPDTLLNRWILPLEKSIDYLTLPDGSKVQVPFNAFLVFCSNYDPGTLLEEAFQRKIPYKIRMEDPDEQTFVSIFRTNAEQIGVEYNHESVEYLIQQYYRNGRNMRGCHPRDILRQLVNIAKYEQRNPEMNRTDIDRSVELYFSVMGGAVNV